MPTAVAASVFPSWLAGSAPSAGATADPAACLADLSEAAKILAQHRESEAAQRVARALAEWRRNGGDLAARLGVRARHGKGAQLRQADAIAERNERLVDLAKTLPQPTPQQKARELLRLALAGDPRLTVIRQGAVPMPASSRQLAAILRSGPGVARRK